MFLKLFQCFLHCFIVLVKELKRIFDYNAFIFQISIGFFA